MSRIDIFRFCKVFDKVAHTDQQAKIAQNYDLFFVKWIEQCLTTPNQQVTLYSPVSYVLVKSAVQPVVFLLYSTVENISLTTYTVFDYLLIIGCRITSYSSYICAVKIIFTTYIKENAYITVIGLLLTKQDKSLTPFSPNLMRFLLMLNVTWICNLFQSRSAWFSQWTALWGLISSAGANFSTILVIITLKRFQFPWMSWR